MTTTQTENRVRERFRSILERLQSRYPMLSNWDETELVRRFVALVRQLDELRKEHHDLNVEFARKSRECEEKDATLDAYQAEIAELQRQLRAIETKGLRSPIPPGIMHDLIQEEVASSRPKADENSTRLRYVCPPPR